MPPHRIEIEIESPDNNLDFEMLNVSALEKNSPVNLPNGLTVKWSAPLKKSADNAHIFDLLISIPIGVEINLLSAWLYDKLKEKNPKPRIRINRVEITKIEQGEITRVIQEQIEAE